MPKYSPRLEWVSSVGPDPEFEISAEQWTQLGSHLGVEVPESARAELVNLCIGYMMDKASESTAATEKDVENIAFEMHKKCEPFFHFTSMYFDDRSDAWSEFACRLDATLEAKATRIGLDHLAFDGAPPPEVKEWLANNAIYFAPNTLLLSHLSGIVYSVLGAMADGRYRNKNLDHLRGFKPGNAWKSLLRKIKSWAAEHQLPRNEYLSDGTADRLPRFVFALNDIFPTEYRQQRAASAAAVAMQIKRATGAKG